MLIRNKKRVILKLFSFLFFVAIVTGCSNHSSHHSPEIPVDSTLISFGSGIAYSSTSIANEPAPANNSRAVINTTYLPKDSLVGIYALQTEWIWENEQKVVQNVAWWGVNIFPIFNNSCYVSQGKSGNLFSKDGTKPAYPDYENSALIFYSYYPYTTNVIYDPYQTESRAPRIPITISSTMEKTSDYLYTGGVKCIAGDDYRIELPFKHALTRLRFKIRTDDPTITNRKPLVVKNITVETNSHQGGNMNLSTGDITPNRDGGLTFSYDTDFAFYAGLPEEDSYIGADFLFLPSKNAIYSIELSILMQDGKTTETFQAYDFETDPSIELVKGSIHTAKIRYSSRANLQCTITGWEEEIIDGEINADTPTEKEIRAMERSYIYR
ncbi:MAG: fimbrillin family protein [Phocaeicola sp.]